MQTGTIIDKGGDEVAIVRRSRKRDAMLQLLQSTKSHPSADWIYRQMKPEFSDLSLGTVYRNLNQLSEERIIRRLGVIQGQERFDADTSPHAHFVCNCCGVVIDLPDDPTDEGYVQSLCEQYGFVVEGHEFMLKGVCQSCKENKLVKENLS